MVTETLKNGLLIPIDTNRKEAKFFKTTRKQNTSVIKKKLAVTQNIVG
jgi:hypothetical protein